MYKLSFYNFYFPIERGVYLLYNSLSNALCEVSCAQFENIVSLRNELFELNSLSFTDQETQVFLNNGMVIHNSVNEADVVRDLLNLKKIQNKKMRTLSVVILPTNSCNMKCPYCFEGVKSEFNKLKIIDKSVLGHLMRFFREAIEQGGTDRYKELYVEWYGGEPLMAPEIIEYFSKPLINFAKENGLDYTSKIITNGTLLTQRIWDMFVEYKILDVQVTLDGDNSTHNKKRPLCNDQDSYYTIMKNLQSAPKDLKVAIRINADKDVVPTVAQLMDDLAKYNIWPDKRNIHPYLAHKEYYAGGSTEDESLYYSPKEFYLINEGFRENLVERFNKWASERMDVKFAKKIHPYPQKHRYTCKLADLPTGIVIDADGYVHKCMTTVNEHNDRMGHISNFDYDDSLFQRWLNFDKLSIEQCSKCKILPVCREDCTQRMLNGTPRCSELKFFLKEEITAYYYENFVENENRNN